MTESGASKKILIVDDDRATRVLLRAMLQAAGEPFDVSDAIGGQQALHMIEHGRPDLVLLDILMPDLDGISICSAVKHNHATRDIKIIMVTARHDERMISASVLAGADDYIAKPFTQEQLVDLVRRVLQAPQHGV